MAVKTQFTEEYQWRLAKVLKHGYTSYELPKEEDEARKAVTFLLEQGVKLVPGKHFGTHTDEYGKDMLVTPTKAQIKQIAKILDKEFGIGVLENL